MIKKLYEIGCFNYQKFILEHTKELSLNSDETLVLIKILDIFEKDKSLSSEDIMKRLSLTKNKTDKTLASLLERSFYEIYINYDQGTGEEYISVDGFFSKVEAIIDNKVAEPQDEMYTITQYVTKEFNRILTSKDLEILSSLVYEDRYTLEDIKLGIEKIKERKKILSIRGLVQSLSTDQEKETVKPKPKVMKDFYDSIK